MNIKETLNCSYNTGISLKGNNVDADDLDEETLQKLRGDTIGDTLYSQSFVLKTLLQFSDLKWSQEVEDDLCFLWDMTVEKDVCRFLLDLSCPSLVCNAILNYRDNNRFIEIVIGILGNLYCSGIENSMNMDEISIILNIIDSDDHLILIQLMRFISASVESVISLIDSEYMEKICFILKNSINSDLLLKTSDCTVKLTSDFKINKDLIDFNLYESVLASNQTLTNLFEPDTKENLLTARYLLQIITNICGYIDKFEKNVLLIEIQKHSNTLTHEITKILKYFSHEENLLPITDEIIFLVSAIMYIFTNLKLNYVSDIFLSTTIILYKNIDVKDEINEVFEPAIELECYLISCSQYDTFKRDLRNLSKQKVKKISELICDNYKKYQSELNLKNINEFIQYCN